MNRGSNTFEKQYAEMSKASMRPRFMNRGSEARGHVRGACRGRFNEAPIHESGKSGQTR